MKYYDLAKPNNLKTLRRQKGITQQVLAMVCRQTASKISCYENGKVMPSYFALVCIAKFLAVEVREIYPRLAELEQMAEEMVQKTKNYYG
jgi:transcriptional regulator with XRE-family HTH domain